MGSNEIIYYLTFTSFFSEMGSEPRTHQSHLWLHGCLLLYMYEVHLSLKAHVLVYKHNNFLGDVQFVVFLRLVGACVSGTHGLVYRI